MDACDFTPDAIIHPIHQVHRYEAEKIVQRAIDS